MASREGSGRLGWGGREADVFSAKPWDVLDFCLNHVHALLLFFFFFLRKKEKLSFINQLAVGTSYGAHFLRDLG